MNRQKQERFRWGAVIGTALLVGVVVACLRIFAPDNEAHPWLGVGAAALASVSIYLAGRWLPNRSWGIITALLLAFGLLGMTFRGGATASRLPASDPGVRATERPDAPALVRRSRMRSRRFH